MTTFPTMADNGEVILGVDEAGEPFFCKLADESQGIDFSLIGTFPAKQIIGDPTAGSHQLLSEFAQSDWSGGGQIVRLNEATDLNRYNHGTLESRWPRMLSLLPLTTALTGPNDDVARPLGMFNDAMIVSYGEELKEIDTTDPPTLTGGDTLSDVPLDTGAVDFTGTGTRRLFIPQGASYETWDGSAVAAGAVGVDARAFVVWDHRLYVLETDGEIKYSLDGSAWSAVQATLDPSYVPKRLEVFLDRSENLTIHVITDSAPWAFAPDIPELVRVQWDPPRHPYRGIGSTVFDNELCITAGMGIDAYSGPTTRAIGLDRDNGLPASQRGRIVSLCDEQNGMIALVEGTMNAANDVAVWEGDDNLLDEDVEFSVGESQTSLHVWDRRGWHPLWVDESGGWPATSVQIESRADGTFRLWWGVGGTLYWQALSTDFANPKEQTTKEFAQNGRIRFGSFDGGLEAAEKFAASIEVNTLRCTDDEVVTVYLSIDGGITFTTLGDVTTNGRSAFRIGFQQTFPDGTDWHAGLNFEHLEIDVGMRRGSDTTMTPLLESLVCAYIKKMGDLEAFSFTVDCQAEYKGRGPREIQRHLKRLIGLGFVPFCYRDEWYSVKVAGVAGQDETGRDLSGNRRVSLVESFET